MVKTTVPSESMTFFSFVAGQTALAISGPRFLLLTFYFSFYGSIQGGTVGTGLAACKYLWKVRNT